MIRNLIEDTLVGIIILAIIGLVAIAIGELPFVIACLLTAAGSIGFVARLWFREWREAKRERETVEVMNRNRRRHGIAPIGRATRTAGAYFPNGETIPPIPKAPAPPPPSRGIQPDRPWPR